MSLDPTGSALPHWSGPHACCCSLRWGRNHRPFPQPSLLAGVSHVPCFHSPNFSKRSQRPSLASWEWGGDSTFPQFSSSSARATQRHPSFGCWSPSLWGRSACQRIFSAVFWSSCSLGAPIWQQQVYSCLSGPYSWGPTAPGMVIPHHHHRQDHRDPSQDGIDCPFLLFLTPTQSSCSASLHRKNSPSLCGQDHWDRISALSRASWSAQTSWCWTVPSEPSGSSSTAGNGKDLFSKFEPKYNQPSPVPLSIRHRHLAGEELIAHRFTMSLIGVDMSRELWPPPGCQDARDAGRPGGYLVCVRSQQALSLHVKIVNRRARSHPSTLQDGEINFSTLPMPRGGRELPWKQTFHWFWRKLLSICNNDDLLEGLGSKSDTPLKGKWFFSPHKKKKLLKHRRLLINNGA